MVYASRRYPWGEEAFQKAKKENKPIFLSGEVLFDVLEVFCSHCMIPLSIKKYQRQSNKKTSLIQKNGDIKHYDSSGPCIFLLHVLVPNG